MPMVWVWFHLLVILLLFLDLRVFHRHAHAIAIREAVAFSIFWIVISLLFMVPLYFLYQHHFDASVAAIGAVQKVERLGTLSGAQAATLYFTGYLVEKALSVDNLFVFLVIFAYFRVEPRYQHRVLFWGILGAIVMRAAFILAGAALIQRFHWLLFIFAAFLVFTGVRMAIKSEQAVHPEKNLVLRICRRWLKVTPDYVQGRFVVRHNGQRMFTPLFIVLLVIETSDVVFATDSIPAILGITTDPFIVYSSNIFAILGLRALFFALSGLMEMFHLLHYGLAAILVFIGAKMFLEAGHHYPDWPLPSYDMPTPAALGVIAGILLLSILASWLFPRRAMPTPELDRSKSLKKPG
ncbi:MAG: TerC family protein [Phycisphaeraceae bacterium]